MDCDVFAKGFSQFRVSPGIQHFRLRVWGSGIARL
jgi:hypothetical protein